MTTRALALAVLLGLGLAACGGGSSHANTTSTTSSAAASALADRGAGLVQVKPCLVCHTTNGASAAGPTFAGLAGSRVKLTDGATITADDAYLKRSIIDPEAQTVAGYTKGLMTTLVKPHSITPRDADAIVAYIDTLAAPGK